MSRLAVAMVMVNTAIGYRNEATSWKVAYEPRFRKENLFEIVPNPFNNSFNLLLKESFSENTFVEIIDVTGKVIDQIHLTGITIINIGEQLNNGIYFIRLCNEDFKSHPIKIAKVN